MSFLTSYSNTQSVLFRGNQEAYIKEFLDRLEHQLKISEIHDIKRDIYSISFCGAMFRFAWNGWNMFNGITKGNIRFVDKGFALGITYQIYFTEFFVIALAFTPVLLSALYTPAMMFVLFVAIWLLFYGLSRAISVARFKRFVESLIYELYLKHAEAVITIAEHQTKG